MDNITYDDDGNPIVRCRWDRRPVEWAGNLSAIFEVDGVSCDAILSEKQITVVPMGGKTLKRQKSKGLFKRSKSVKGDSSDGSSAAGSTFLLTNVLGVKIKREKQASHKEGEGVCKGVMVYTFDCKEKDPGRYKFREILLGNPAEDCCVRWAKRIKDVVSNYEGRPRRLQIYMQPHAGKGYTRTLYSNTILPIISAAGVQVNVTEVSHNEQIKQELIHLNLEEIDSVVAIGGDGTVNKVAGALLLRAQTEASNVIRPNFTPARPQLPMGIIPCGVTNQIAFSILGTEDAATATIHILLGHIHPVDVCTVFSEDSLIQWGFTAHYGYFSSALRFMHRFSKFGEKRLEASLIKALTKGKFRSYECEVKYIPTSSAADNPSNGQLCRKGCPVCHVGLESMTAMTYSDEVEYIGDPLNDSNASSISIELTKDESPWKSVKGDYLSISLLSLAAMESYAPRGMSKCCHLADGAMDLILVRNTERREFLRYLKRHGNNKNQLDFPFVESHRVKEVVFHLRTAETWQHKDYSFNEIQYEVEQRATQTRGKPSDDVEVIDDLQEDSDDDLPEDVVTITPSTGSAGSSRRASRTQKSDSPLTGSWTDPKGSASTSRESLDSSKGGKYPNTSGGDRATVVQGFDEEDYDDEINDKESRDAADAKPRVQPGTQTLMYVSDNYRPSLIEAERSRRMKNEQKKAEKKRLKEESRAKTVWNIDNEICTELELHFKVHQGLLLIHGQGVPPQYEPDDVRMGCLAVF